MQPQQSRHALHVGPLVGLLGLSFFINYIDRSNLSVAAPILKGELNLTSEQIGLLLSGFFWTYALLQLCGIAGWLVQRYNVYKLYALAFLFWTGATALAGFAQGFTVFFGLRLLLGAGESLAYPAASKILASGVPEGQRGFANSIIDAGAKFGPAIGTLVGGLLMERFGWRAFFIALGAGSLIWLIPWWRVTANIESGANASQMKAEANPIPAARILALRVFWGGSLGLFCFNYVWYFILTWLPTYLVKGMGLTITNMAFAGAFAYMTVGVASMASGAMSDRMIRAGKSAGTVRRAFTTGGLLVAAILVSIGFLQSIYALCAVLIVACVGVGMTSSNVWASTQTVAGPRAAGTWTSLQNGIGNLAGVSAPWITGVTVDATGGSFLAAFALAGAFALLGFFMFQFVMGRVEPVDWGRQ